MNPNKTLTSEYQMIDLILKKIYKLRGKIWKKM